MSRTFILCADDFAQSAGISAAILDLLAARRLSATSVFSQSPLWPVLAPQLAALPDIEVGLHFNLTHPFESTARPLAYWLIKSQLRLLPQHWLEDQLHRQLDAFVTVWGRLPDFIDGHQHVHALPQIREALFATLARWHAAPYLRAPDRLGHAGDRRSKAVILKSVCHGFFHQACEAGYRLPAWFGGLYSLSPQANFPALMAEWLAAAPEGALLMCHPGTGEDADDPISGARCQEYRYLSSAHFADACQLADAKPGLFPG